MEINKKTIQDFKKASDGKKTYVVGAIALIFDVLNDIFPDMLSSDREATIQKVLFYLVYYGVIDKVWRNRQEIIDFIINIFKRKQIKILNK